LSGRWRLPDNGMEWHVIIRQLKRVSVDAAAQSDGGSGVGVMTAERIDGFHGLEPQALELSCRSDEDGNQIVSVAGELDIATADQAYIYLSDVIDAWPVPVSVDLSGLTFCDASGLGALARIARHARQAGRQLRMVAARPSLLKIMRITGLDRTFPELVPSVAAH
jgi:anti-sigma B factor antagonist